MIKYFVAYDFVGHCGSGRGNVDVTAIYPISSIKEVREMEAKLLHELGLKAIVITNFQRFEESDGD